MYSRTSRNSRNSRFFHPRRGRSLGGRRERNFVREEPVWPLPDLADLPATVIATNPSKTEIDIGYVRPATDALPERHVVPHRTPVFAVQSGVIFSIGRRDGLLEINVDHRNGYWSTYAGLIETTYPIGRARHRVARGEIIGYVGSSDAASVRPLRFSISQLTRDALAFPIAIDPMIVMSGRVHLSADRSRHQAA